MKTIRSLRMIIALIGTVLISTEAYSQCHTDISTVPNWMNKMTQFTQNSIGQSSPNFCVRVYFHIIRDDNGQGGVSLANVDSALKILNQDFRPFNIRFIADTNIHYIDSSSLYNTASPSVFNQGYDHQDGVDIYLFPPSNTIWGRATDGQIGNGTQLYVTGTFTQLPPNIPLHLTSVLSHEMGHVFILQHTHVYTDGLFPINAPPNACRELVDGSNSHICGDMIWDTPADNNMEFRVQHPGCSWIPEPDDVDSLGFVFQPDEGNIMSYTNPSCMTHFSMGQSVVMRNALANEPHLQAVLIPNCCIGDNLDLSMKDKPEDNGNNAGYSFHWDLDDSPDIWVRNNNDGLTHQVHENPEYALLDPTYVYVRITNLSCVPSTGTEQLSLYWTKASSNSSWPQNWDGTVPLLGNKIGDTLIPIIQPGDSAILEFTWFIDENTGVGTTWNNCLLARIENSTADPIINHPGDLAQDVYQNNNISLRNVVIENYIPSAPNQGSGKNRYFYVGNPFEDSKTYDVIFRNAEFTQHTLTNIAEVHFDVQSGDHWDFLLPYLTSHPAIDIQDDNRFTVNGLDPVVLSNIEFPPYYQLQLSMDVNFLIDEIEIENDYEYHVLQKNSEPHSELGEHWTGGIHFMVRKSNRQLFDADAGDDHEINQGDSIVISASQINEAAEYYWYNSNGKLVHIGESFTISPEVSETYQLEVIALADGFKDYADVSVEVHPSYMESVIPNPVNSNATITYSVENGLNGFIAVVDPMNSTILNNYILDPISNTVTIDFSGYQSGTYTLTMIVNGQIVDALNIIVSN